MLFNSFDFFLFFPFVLLLFFALPQKVKWMWLLACSVYFYMCWKAKYILLMGFSILVTYIGSLLIEKWRSRKYASKVVLAITLLANFGVLFLFKYYDLFRTTVQGMAQNDSLLPAFSLILPVGISFYTFQAVGYSIDVYRQTLKAERNFFRYALFVSFFPQLVAGPIERASNLLPQFYQKHKFDYNRMRHGLLLMGWGFFQKIFLADRVAILVNNVYNNPQSADGSVVFLATLFFSIQIYCDFGSYSNIAIGAAEIMGFKLMKNFNAPYFATSIKDFWRRWHISLSTWFKDYVYIPLGGSRKGLWRTCINVMIVFLISGLWHGAAITFIVWGGLHGLFQVLETFGSKLLPAQKQDNRLWAALRKGLCIFATFMLVNFSWVFFRADSLESAKVIFSQIFSKWNFSALSFISLEKFGLDKYDFWAAIIGIALLLIIDAVSQKKDVRELVLGQRLPVRWAVYFALIILVVIFGVYGPQYSATPFIYFQF